MGKSDDIAWMSRALDLAARASGETNPNPMVGCVVVRDGQVVGEGYHRRAGGPHAEVFALDQAGEKARGSTLYVTLEPCAHLGRTPPCSGKVIASRVARVVAAVKDPNPPVNGRGLALMRRAGIAVETGVLGDDSFSLNRRFMVAAGRQSPYVLLKAALTLDGRIATARRESKWITSPLQRRAARALRRLHDGVAVGIGTVLADDPMLLPEPRVGRPFHRIVFDTRLRLPAGSRLVRSARRSPVWALCGPVPAARRRALEGRGVRVLEGKLRGTRVAPAWALEALWREGLWSLMVEGGAELLGSFLADRLLDEVALFRAPVLLGGRGSLPAFGGPDPGRLSDGLRLTAVDPLVSRQARAAAAPSAGLYEVWYPARRRR